MACTSPINIDSTTTDYKCLLKCQYFFNYGSSSVRIDNESIDLKIHYDGDSDVVYNSNKYTPTSIQIYTPSLHTYDGVTADAEILILHESDSGGDLIVSVPVIADTSPTLSSSSNIMSDLINNAPGSPSDGTTSFSMDDFNLNYFIPKAPYYSYQGTFPYSCTDNTQYDYIVFNKRDSPLYINADVLTKLQSLISPAPSTIYAAGIAYYNDTGTVSNGFDGDGQIYIDCQPTGADGEILYSEDSDGNEVPLGGGGDSDDGSDVLAWVLNSLYFVIGVILMLIVFWAAKKWVFKRVTESGFERIMGD